jgi:hypothetical protein
MRYSVRKGFAFPVVVKRSEALPLYMKAKPKQMISGFGKAEPFRKERGIAALPST